MKWLLALFLCVSQAAYAQQAASSDAALGLQWGMSSSQVRDLGVSLTPMPDSNSFGQTFSAAKLPRAISDADIVFLSFGFDDKLWRIVIASKDFEGDPYGTAVKSRYNELLAALTEKYGKGTSQHHAARLYETESFVMGLSSGQNWWYTNFSSKVANIQLALQAKYSTARWMLYFENKPLHSQFEKAKREREKGAL
jgi:hypothetical protein